jgi:organic hydroperoxide reductase OsmC/OhrA
MQPLPHVYSVTALAGDDGRVSLHAAGLPTLASAPPREFDGPGDRWSPESLLTAAVASCFILTFRAVARVQKLEWTTLECEVEGTLERVEDRMQFTRMLTRAILTVPAGTHTESCERALERAEERCLIANSLRCKRELRTEIVKGAGSQLESA